MLDLIQIIARDIPFCACGRLNAGCKHDGGLCQGAGDMGEHGQCMGDKGSSVRVGGCRRAAGTWLLTRYALTAGFVIVACRDDAARTPFLRSSPPTFPPSYDAASPNDDHYIAFKYSRPRSLLGPPSSHFCRSQDAQRSTQWYNTFPGGFPIPVLAQCPIESLVVPF